MLYHWEIIRTSQPRAGVSSAVAQGQSRTKEPRTGDFVPDREGNGDHKEAGAFREDSSGQKIMVKTSQVACQWASMCVHTCGCLYSPREERHAASLLCVMSSAPKHRKTLKYLYRHKSKWHNFVLYTPRPT